MCIFPKIYPQIKCGQHLQEQAGKEAAAAAAKKAYEASFKDDPEGLKAAQELAAATAAAVAKSRKVISLIISSVDATLYVYNGSSP